MEIFLNKYRYLYLEHGQIAASSGRTFEVLERIGAGGNGAVYSCIDSSGSEYAVKFLLNTSKKSEERFRRETLLMQRVHHPHLMRYIDAGSAEMVDKNDRSYDISFMIMEKADKNLVDLLQSQQTISYEEYAAQFRGLCEALEELHHYAIHRDIKPENILIKGETWVLSDFGLCRFLDAEENLDDLTRTNEKVGPAFWMSPEAVNRAYFGENAIGPHSDVFQLCAVFTFVLTRQFPGGLIAPTDSLNTTPAIREVLVDSLAHEISARPPDGHALLERFNRATILL